jgi:hypothetical protein
MGILRTNKISGLETPTPVTGSVYFDGSGDYLQLAASNDFDFGTGNFTVEWFQYWNSIPPNYQTLLSINYSTNPNLAIQTSGGTSTRYIVYVNGTSTTITEGSGGPIQKWTHYAVVRNGTIISIYQDGILTGSGTYSGNVGNSTATIQIAGEIPNQLYYFNGYISNFRILKGTALYTSNFTPPVNELQRIGDTVLLCCNNPDSAGAEATGKTITVNGNAAASTFSPGLTRDFTFGTQFSGVGKFDTQGYFVPPSGTTEQQFPNFAGVNAASARGVFGAGFMNPATHHNTLDYITISTTGNATDFGDLTVARERPSACASPTRGVWGGGNTPSALNTIDYITIASTGNAQDFGDFSYASSQSAACASSTRGIWGGGVGWVNNISYITIASTGNAFDFGDLSLGRENLGACSSSTRGVFGGGRTPTIFNTIDYITISTTGNAVDFGDLTTVRNRLSACSSSTRGLFGGGTTGTILNTVDYITIASIGNAIDFGDLTQERNFPGACSSSIRGVWGGGYSPSVNPSNVMDYVTIATIGNAQDFGDLSTARYGLAACSNGHGGLG